MELLSDIERLLLDALLEGDHPLLNTLRVQARTAWVTKRETRSGVQRVTLAVANEVPAIPSRTSIIHDVTIWTTEENQYVGSPALWVSSGRLAMLGVPSHLLECGIPLTDCTVSYWV